MKLLIQTHQYLILLMLAALVSVNALFFWNLTLLLAQSVKLKLHSMNCYQVANESSCSCIYQESPGQSKAFNDVVTHKTRNWHLFVVWKWNRFLILSLSCYHAHTHWESEVAKSPKRLLNLIETHLLFITILLLLNRAFNQGRQCPAKEALTSQKIPMVATTTMATIGLMNFMATRPMS